MYGSVEGKLVSDRLEGAVLLKASASLSDLDWLQAKWVMNSKSFCLANMMRIAAKA